MRRSLGRHVVGSPELALQAGGRGFEVVFRVEGRRAVLARTADLLDLAGVVSVPASKRATPWEKVRRQVRAARARDRR